MRSLKFILSVCLSSVFGKVFQSCETRATINTSADSASKMFLNLEVSEKLGCLWRIKRCCVTNLPDTRHFVSISLNTCSLSSAKSSDDLPTSPKWFWVAVSQIRHFRWYISIGIFLHLSRDAHDVLLLCAYSYWWQPTLLLLMLLLYKKKNRTNVPSEWQTGGKRQHRRHFITNH